MLLRLLQLSVGGFMQVYPHVMIIIIIKVVWWRDFFSSIC
jgi:hypothetical protein